MKINPVLITILVFPLLLMSCDKTKDESDKFVGNVLKNGQLTNIKMSSFRLTDEKIKSFSLHLYKSEAEFSMGSITFRNIPFKVGSYILEPRVFDTLTSQYLNNINTDYIVIDVDAISDLFRLVGNHNSNNFNITDINKAEQKIKGTFNLVYERDPMRITQLPDPNEPDTIIFNNGDFNFKYD